LSQRQEKAKGKIKKIDDPYHGERAFSKVAEMGKKLPNFSPRGESIATSKKEKKESISRVVVCPDLGGEKLSISKKRPVTARERKKLKKTFRNGRGSSRLGISPGRTRRPIKTEMEGDLCALPILPQRENQKPPKLRKPLVEEARARVPNTIRQNRYGEELEEERRNDECNEKVRSMKKKRLGRKKPSINTGKKKKKKKNSGKNRI